MKGPLSGVRVIDISRAISGPYGAMVLADLGAEVIHVEAPEGETSRFRAGPNYKGESFHYLSWNRNKKNVVLDFGSKMGKEAFFDLVKISDIVWNNFRPGSMERLGADYESLKKINPRIIYVSITGYGPTGPFKGRPAFDVAVLGHTGVLNLTGEPDGTPVRPGPPLADMGGGIFCGHRRSFGASRKEPDRKWAARSTSPCRTFPSLFSLTTSASISSPAWCPNHWTTRDTLFPCLTAFTRRRRVISLSAPAGQGSPGRSERTG